VTEPLIVFGLQRGGIWGGGGLLDYPWLWATEIAIGLGGIACALVWARGWATRTG
jgi:hypothetical protein